MENVKFIPIEGFGNYLACSDGYVINSRTGARIVGEIKNSGYREITIFDDEGNQKSRLVHRIIAKSFCEKKDEEDEVNHINGDKDDNRACNLEWVTREENLKHAFETGLSPIDTSPRKVVGINMETGEEMRFPSIYKAARFLNISQGNICMCCKGIRPHAGGFFWEYERSENGKRHQTGQVDTDRV